MIWYNINLKQPDILRNQTQQCGFSIGGYEMRRIPHYKESLKIVRSALEAETQEVVQVSNRLNDNLVEANRKIWRHTLFIWVAVILSAIFYFLVLHNTITTKNQSKQETVALQTLSPSQDKARPLLSPLFHSKTAPLSVAVPDKEGLLKLLNQIREAQSKKDIRLFLNAYSPTFPNLAKKRWLTLNLWKRYDYLESQFHFNSLKQENASMILAEITWNIKAQDRKTRVIKMVTKSYNVQFSKQSGKWLIQELEPVKSKTN